MQIIKRIVTGYRLVFPKLDPKKPPAVAPTSAVLAVTAWIYSWVLEAALIVLQLFFQRRFSWPLHLTLVTLGLGLTLIAWLRRTEVIQYGHRCTPVRITPFQACFIVISSYALLMLIFLIAAGKFG